MLLSDSGSNVLLYLSGHGGDGFLKFRDVSNVQSHDLSDALETMRTQQRFKEMLVLVDTCQAATIPEPFHTPRVTSIFSFLRGENSYASAYDDFMGQALFDRFTYSTLRFVSCRTFSMCKMLSPCTPCGTSHRCSPRTCEKCSSSRQQQQQQQQEEEHVCSPQRSDCPPSKERAAHS
jgi:hypothetical protein